MHQIFSERYLFSLGWTTYWVKGFPVNTWVYEWKHVRKKADTVRCWFGNRMYPAIMFSVRAMFAPKSIKQLQWLLEIIPLVVWSASGDQVNSEDILRIQKSFPTAELFLAVSKRLFKPLKSSLKTDYFSQTKYIKGNSKWVLVTSSKDNTCETFTYTHANFILFWKANQLSSILKEFDFTQFYSGWKGEILPWRRENPSLEKSFLLATCAKIGIIQ